MDILRKFLGLNKTLTYSEAPQNLLSDALHIEKPHPSAQYIESARGNELCYALPSNYPQYAIRGAYQLEEKDQFIVLVINNKGTAEVGILDNKKKKYCPIIQDEELDCPLGITHCTWTPVFGNVISKCNTVKIYFVTNNVSRSIAVFDPCKAWDDTKLMKARCVGSAKVRAVDGLGRLPNGMYQVSINVSDGLGAVTNYGEFSMPICVAAKQCRAGQETDFGIVIEYDDLPIEYTQAEIVIRECVVFPNSGNPEAVRTKVIQTGYGGGTLRFTYTGSEGVYRDNVTQSVKARVPKVFEGGDMFTHDGKLGLFNTVPRRTFNIQKYVSTWRVRYYRALVPVREAKNWPTLRSNENYPISVSLNMDDGVKSDFAYELINDHYDDSFVEMLPTDHPRNCTNCPQPYFRFHDTSERDHTLLKFEDCIGNANEIDCEECGDKTVRIEVSGCNKNYHEISVAAQGYVILSESKTGAVIEGEGDQSFKVKSGESNYEFDVTIKTEDGCVYSGTTSFTELCEGTFDIDIKKATKYKNKSGANYEGENPGEVNGDIVTGQESAGQKSFNSGKTPCTCPRCAGYISTLNLDPNGSNKSVETRATAEVEGNEDNVSGQTENSSCNTFSQERCLNGPELLYTSVPDVVFDYTDEERKVLLETCTTCEEEDGVSIISGSKYVCKGNKLFLVTDEIPSKSAPIDTRTKKKKNGIDSYLDIDSKYMSHELRAILADDCVEQKKPIPFSMGKFGYWETEEVYPSLKVCSANGEESEYWGELTGKKRRLFRVPSITKEPIYIAFRKGVPYRLDPANDPCDDAYVVVTGIKVDGINLPKEVTDRLCKKNPLSFNIGERGEQDKSVISTGPLISMFAGDIQDEEYLFPKNGWNSSEFYDAMINPGGNNTLRRGRSTDIPAYTYHPADFHLWGNKQQGDYMFIEQEEFGVGRRLGDYIEGEDATGWRDQKCNNAGRRNHVSLTGYKDPQGVTERQPIVMCVKALKVADADSVVSKDDNFTASMINKCRERSQYIEFTEQIPEFTEDAKGEYGSTNVGDGRSDNSFIGDVIDHEAYIPNVRNLTGTLMRYLPNQYGSVTHGNYVPLGVTATKDTLECCEIVGFGGDSFVGPFSIKRTACISDKAVENLVGEEPCEVPFSESINLNSPLPDEINIPLVNLPSFDDGEVGEDPETIACNDVFDRIEREEDIVLNDSQREALCNVSRENCVTILENAGIENDGTNIDAYCQQIDDANGGGFNPLGFISGAISSAFKFLVNALSVIVEFFLNMLLRIVQFILNIMLAIINFYLNFALGLISEVLQVVLNILNSLYCCIKNLIKPANCGEVPVSGSVHIRHTMSLRGDMRAVQGDNFEVANPTGGDCPDAFGPHLLKQVIKTFTISDANLNLRAGGDVDFGNYKQNNFGTAEVFEGKLAPFNLDSSYGGKTDYRESFIPRFFVNMCQPSKLDNLARNVLEFIVVCVVFIAFIWLGIDSIIGGIKVIGGGTFGLQTVGAVLSIAFGLALIVAAYRWIRYAQGTGSNVIRQSIDRFLRIEWCYADIGFLNGPGCEWGMDMGKYIKQFEDNYFSYNVDYSKQNTVERVFGVPPLPDFSYCPKEKSGTIMVSQKQSPDTHLDLWQRFNVAERVTIPRDRGELMKVVSLGGVVLAHTTETLFRIAGSAQRVAQGEDGIYIGNVNLFGEPQDLFANAQEGFAGLKDPNAAYLTSVGYFFPDGKKWYRYSSSISEIAFNGMEEFMDCNMELDLLEDFPDYKNRDQKNGGVGYDFGIDYNRGYIYLMKKDYKKIDSKVVFEDGQFKKDGKIVSLHGPNFMDTSFLLAYNLRTNTFEGRHKWCPQFFLWNRREMFSVANNSVYTHDTKGNFATWNGETEAVYIEMPINLNGTGALKEFEIENISIIGDVIEVDENGNEKKLDLPVVDEFMIFNSYQATQWIPLRKDGVKKMNDEKTTAKRSMLGDIAKTEEGRWVESGNCIQLFDYEDQTGGSCVLDKYNPELCIYEPNYVKGKGRILKDDFMVIRLLSRKDSNVKVRFRKVILSLKADPIVFV